MRGRPLENVLSAIKVTLVCPLLEPRQDFEKSLISGVLGTKAVHLGSVHGAAALVFPFVTFSSLRAQIKTLTQVDVSDKVDTALGSNLDNQRPSAPDSLLFLSMSPSAE